MHGQARVHRHAIAAVAWVKLASLFALNGCGDDGAKPLATQAIFSGQSSAGVAPVLHVCTGAVDETGLACDDGDPCTAGDSCDAGACQGDRIGLLYGAKNAEEAFAVALLSDGGFALAGYTASSGAGLTDMWLVRTDAQGRRVWDRTYGTAQSDQASAVLALSDGFVLAGFQSADAEFNGARMWLIRTDTQGKPIWDASYGGAGSTWADALVARPGGGYALAGSAIAPGATTADGSLVAVSAEGKLLWDQPIGGAKEDGIRALAALSDGFAAAGFTQSSGAGKSDAWLVRTNAAGAVQWQQTFGGVENEEFGAMTAVKDGFVLAGFTQSKGKGKSDLWVVRTDASGKSLWDRAYGGPAVDGARGVAVLSDGTLALGGDTDGSPGTATGGSRQSWLLRLDAKGNFLAERNYGTPGSETFASALLPLTGGGFALAGGTSRQPGLAYDMWLVRADAQGISTCE